MDGVRLKLPLIDLAARIAVPAPALLAAPAHCPLVPIPARIVQPPNPIPNLLSPQDPELVDLLEELVCPARVFLQDVGVVVLQALGRALV